MWTHIMSQEPCQGWAGTALQMEDGRVPQMFLVPPPCSVLPSQPSFRPLGASSWNPTVAAPRINYQTDGLSFCEVPGCQRSHTRHSLPSHVTGTCLLISGMNGLSNSSSLNSLLPSPLSSTPILPSRGRGRLQGSPDVSTSPKWKVILSLHKSSLGSICSVQDSDRKFLAQNHRAGFF